MRSPRWILLCLLLAGCGSNPQIAAAPAGSASAKEPGPGRPLTAAQIAERATPSVVLIRTPSGLGTGFIVSADGRVVTNLHVIAGAAEAVVVLGDGRTFGDVEVIGVDEQRDLAVIHIPATKLPAVTLGDSGAVHPGDRVVAIGHPLGLGNTVSDGLVSAVRVLDESLTLLQISAPIAPGSSGGPLFNEKGEVIGVATLYSNAGQNLNFGVPVGYLKPLMAGDEHTPLADFARATVGQRLPAPPARKIPHHDPKILATCSQADLEIAFDGIGNAIQVGAPLYNDGNADACFRVYEGAALAIDKKLKSCIGVKKALSEGVARAGTLQSPVDKAWAMRDAFDGLLEVIARRRPP